MTAAETFDDSHLTDDPQPRTVRSEYLGRPVPAKVADADDLAAFVAAADRGRSNAAAFWDDWDRKRTTQDRSRTNKLFASLTKGGTACPAVIDARDREHNRSGKPIREMARLMSLLRLAEQGHEGALDAATDFAQSWRHRTSRDSERVIEYALSYIARDGLTPNDKKGCCRPLPEEPPYDPPYDPGAEPPPYEEPPDEEPAGEAGDNPDEGNSWAGIDLGPYLRGEVKPITPTLGGWREDGVLMLYPGCEHSCLGEMECGKSWFALAHVAAELIARRRVIYVHFEESNPSDTVNRLLTLAVAPDLFAGLTFIAPDRPVQEWNITTLVELRPSLVVFDGVNEAMSLHGQGIREEDGAAAYRRRLVKPFTRAGAAVLSLDHVVKSSDHNGQGYALGSVHKGNGLSGASFLIENVEAFGRGRRGVSHVFVVKDRPGELRRQGRPTKVPRKFYFATMTVDATTPDAPARLELHAPKPEDATSGVEKDGDDALAEKALAAVKTVTDAGIEPTQRMVLAEMGGRASVARRTLDKLVIDKRLIESPGLRRAVLYRRPAEPKTVESTASQDHEAEPLPQLSLTASATASHTEGTRDAVAESKYDCVPDAVGRSGTQSKTGGEQ